jgi:surfeit locus 1 family protein
MAVRMTPTDRPAPAAAGLGFPTGLLGRLFSRRWLFATLLVLTGALALARLGFWQLDRLETRRAFNARVQAQLQAPPLELSAAALQDGALVSSLPEMEYRSASLRGQYDFSQQVALRNQVDSDLPGVHLLTPLRIAGSDQAILVDRGWVPFADFSAGRLAQYAEPGPVEVRGLIRRSQVRPEIGWRRDAVPEPGTGRLEAWHMVNVAGIAAQTPYPLLPVYLQQAPDPSWTSLPHRGLPDLELSEGPHLGYAFQWFAFAALLLGGYPFYIMKQERATPC